MRIWTVHPHYLDSRGLVALWREALLAQKVLQGLTKGYTAHPQLHRFRAHPDPVAAIGSYLVAVHEESLSRGYRFDRTKIVRTVPTDQIVETDGQLLYEWRHLKKKLESRDHQRFRTFEYLEKPEPHPLFRIVSGEVQPWERIDSNSH